MMFAVFVVFASYSSALETFLARVHVSMVFHQWLQRIILLHQKKMALEKTSLFLYFNPQQALVYGGPKKAGRLL